jgi:hypothetical protein
MKGDGSCLTGDVMRQRSAERQTVFVVSVGEVPLALAIGQALGEVGRSLFFVDDGVDPEVAALNQLLANFGKVPLVDLTTVDPFAVCVMGMEDFPVDFMAGSEEAASVSQSASQPRSTLPFWQQLNRQPHSLRSGGGYGGAKCHQSGTAHRRRR